MDSGDDLYLELESDFSAIARQLFTLDTVDGTLQRIVDLAELSIDGCDGAGVFTIAVETAVTMAASNAMVEELDRAQIATNEGPCIDAATTGRTFHATDLVSDDRWPAFAPRAVAAGVRSILAHSLSTQQASALNLYGRLPAAFGATGRGQGQLFATLAGLALESAHGRASEDDRVANLTQALRTRELIGQAQGILMERERITAEQAFNILRRASQHLNVRLRAVAATLVETGERPAEGQGATAG